MDFTQLALQPQVVDEQLHEFNDRNESLISNNFRGVPSGGIDGFIPPKLPKLKLNLTAAAEYVANLANVNMWWL